MRIAYICADPGIPVFGQKGASIHVQEVSRALQQQGAQVALFTPRLGGPAPAGLENVSIHQLPAIPKGNLAEREQKLLAANDHLQKALRQAGSFDMVYERYSLWSYAGMAFASDAQVPAVLEVNAPLIEEQADHRGLIDRAGAVSVAEQVFGTANAIVAVSDGVADYVNTFPQGQGRVTVIPNGVNPTRFPANIAPAIPKTNDTFTIGFVGTLKPWHGLETLLESFATLHRLEPKTRLLIVGDGPQREMLEQMIATQRLSHAVKFTGAVAPETVPSWLAAMDVAVAPYPNLPNFYFSPLKVYEYMASGLSVVASRIGQIVSIIENAVTGLLCSPGNPESLTGALQWLQAEPELRQKMGQTARQMVLTNYTWEAVARRILTLADLEAASNNLRLK